jgi:MFS superfamily sulfate permease-like transporter
MSVLAGIKVPGKTFVNDVRTGLVMALINVPGGLANGLLAGVNPVFGLYSMIAGTTVAAFFTSSVIMNVDSTSATALATLETLRYSCRAAPELSGGSGSAGGVLYARHWPA